MATLRVISGPLAGQEVEVYRDVTVGRQNADLTIDDAQVSRRHAVLRLVASGLEVEDLGSSNGTFVDGRRIDAPTPVPAGGKVRIGETVLELDATPSAGATRIVSPRPRGETHGETRAPGLGASKQSSVSPAPAAAGSARRGDVPAPPPQAPQASSGANPNAGSGASAAASSSPVGEFHPPARRRSARLASRSWVPVALSYGSVVLTALALVIYFAAR